VLHGHVVFIVNLYHTCLSLPPHPPHLHHPPPPSVRCQRSSPSGWLRLRPTTTRRKTRNGTAHVLCLTIAVSCAAPTLPPLKVSEMSLGCCLRLTPNTTARLF
jgi:hypothetical protein